MKRGTGVAILGVVYFLVMVGRAFVVRHDYYAVNESVFYAYFVGGPLVMVGLGVNFCEWLGFKSGSRGRGRQ